MTTHAPMARFMTIAAWVTALVILTWIFGNWEDNQDNPNRSPESHVSGNVREVILQGNRAAHYVVDGKLNGQNVTFMLDTGATHVALSADLAKRLGVESIDKGMVQTANGVVSVGLGYIDTLDIGPIHLQKVSTTIGANMPDDTVLLGMSALKQLQLTQTDNKLVLRQIAP